ncbi:MAG: transketolase [archaeon]|nr:transketolase [archaeon]
MSNNSELADISKAVRREVLKMTTAAGSGHPGGSLSSADIVTSLYFSEMKQSAKNPNDPERDKFILSKGHACPLLYAILAELEYFPKEELSNLRKISSMLQGHPDRNKTPGVESSTGSLGQGLSVACGIALGDRLSKRKSRTYCLIGCGESQEGQVWEAAMSAAHYKLDNLCAIVDNNNLQIDGKTSEVMNIEPIADKWKAFGWNVLEIDGHNFNEILNAFKEARACKGKPTVLVAKTVKGKGVSFMENVCGYHGMALTAEELERALEELK